MARTKEVKIMEKALVGLENIRHDYMEYQGYIMNLQDAKKELDRELKKSVKHVIYIADKKDLNEMKSIDKKIEKLNALAKDVNSDIKTISSNLNKSYADLSKEISKIDDTFKYRYH